MPSVEIYIEDIPERKGNNLCIIHFISALFFLKLYLFIWLCQVLATGSLGKSPALFLIAKYWKQPKVT